IPHFWVRMVILVFLRALRRYYRSHPGSLRSGEPPLAQRHNRPDGFHDPKWPSALQEAVGGSQGARYCEGQDEPWAALFERVTDERSEEHTSELQSLRH